MHHLTSLVRILALIAFAAAISACGNAVSELSRAEPSNLRGACEQPTERESKILQSAADAIALDEAPISNSLTIGGQKLLGYGLVRTGSRTSQRVCTPQPIFAQVGAALNAPKGLGAGQLVEYQLQLAVQLPNPSDFVIDQVGRAAFNSDKQHSEIFPRQDIRPFARSALASFGKRASAFRQSALKEMSSDSALGTGAAQVAAAVGDPTALPRIVEMLDSLLSSVPPNAAIPLDKRDRLLELAWAIYFAGDAGRSASKSIHKVMPRKVESRAPPFGIVEISPKRFCRVLELIEGQPAIAQYSYCLDTAIPFEQ